MRNDMKSRDNPMGHRTRNEPNANHQTVGLRNNNMMNPPQNSCRDAKYLSTDTLKAFDDSFDDGHCSNNNNNQGQGGPTNPNIIRWSKHTSMSPETPPNPFANSKVKQPTNAGGYRPDAMNPINVHQQHHDHHEDLQGIQEEMYQEDSASHSGHGYPYHTGRQRMTELPIQNEQGYPPKKEPAFCAQQRFNGNQAIYEEKEMSPEPVTPMINELEEVHINDMTMEPQDDGDEDDDLLHDQQPPQCDPQLDTVENQENVSPQKGTRCKQCGKGTGSDTAKYATKDDIQALLDNLEMIKKGFTELSNGVKDQETEIETARKRVENLEKGKVNEPETVDVEEGDLGENDRNGKGRVQQTDRRNVGTAKPMRLGKRRFAEWRNDDDQNDHKRRRVGS